MNRQPSRPRYAASGNQHVGRTHLRFLFRPLRNRQRRICQFHWPHGGPPDRCLSACANSTRRGYGVPHYLIERRFIVQLLSSTNPVSGVATLKWYEAEFGVGDLLPRDVHATVMHEISRKRFCETQRKSRMEQYIFNVFEVIVSTLETKLQRIENLDKAVEHLMRRVEALDSRVNDNIHKTDAIISKLGNLDLKLFSRVDQEDDESYTESNTKNPNGKKITNTQLLDMKLESLDQKVSDIDSKLVGLKNQIDNNFLPVDDINAEASEKKPISLNVIEIAKGLNSEVVNEITKEVDQLRTSMSTVDENYSSI
ncbi:hypothetical protein EVAR_65896_1 [Eumeta japonica]|uniref:Uncharacterized protein n=1 Tax=Eumeta variegata TaxID=151549 RepID=A0A4C2A5R2_EUMVA|nr:hypothetical protein EVAR_65896_1 [Eumeta japonica]